MIRLPSLDCHAHIAADATSKQIARLGSGFVFAVTRSPDEAKVASSRRDKNVVWGFGMHPARAVKGDPDSNALRAQLHSFALVGEVGLDRKSGRIDRQASAMTRVLEAATDQPVLLSLHSHGCVDELLDLLEAYPHAGYILHWFVGDEDQLRRALDLGCHFSVNVAMPEELLLRIPLERLLPETDYPALRRRGASLPGDTRSLETLIGSLHSIEPAVVRAVWYQNLRKLSLSTGAIDRLPEDLVNLLLIV